MRRLALMLMLALVASCGTADEEAAPTPPGEALGPSQPCVERVDDVSERPTICVPDGSPPEELQIEDIVAGEGTEASSDSTAVVHYAGVSWTTGEEFDASWNRDEPFEVGLGRGMVIQGWDEGIPGMKVGGRRRLTIPPGMAYGPEGRPPAIAPNDTLIFVVDLLEIAE